MRTEKGITEKGIRVLSKIKRLAEIELDDNNLKQFLRQSFRYATVYSIVYPGSGQKGPGFLLDDIIEERVFNSRF